MPKPQRRDAIDEESADLLNALQDKQRRQQMTPAQRRKADKDTKRCRFFLDIPPDLLKAINRIAEKEDCSKSSLAAFFLQDAIHRYQRGELPVKKHPSRSPRYTYIVEIPSESENSD